MKNNTIVTAGDRNYLWGIFLQSTLEWVLKQQINFMLLITVFAFISYLNRHYRELREAAAVPQTSVPIKEKS